MPVVYDEGPIGYRDAVAGDSWNRGFLATGLTTGPAVESLIAETLGMLPGKLSSGPAALPGLQVISREIDQIAPESGGSTWWARGRLVYAAPTVSFPSLPPVPDPDGPGVIVSIVSTSEEVESNLDADGNGIETVYDNVAQGHVIRRRRSVTTHTVQRPEPNDARSRRNIHEHTVNDATWSGFAEGTVLLDAVRATTTDGATWVIEYTFAVKPDGWDVLVVHEDPDFPGQPLPPSIWAPGGTPLPGLSELVKVYPRSNFGALNITI